MVILGIIYVPVFSQVIQQIIWKTQKEYFKISLLKIAMLSCRFYSNYKTEVGEFSVFFSLLWKLGSWRNYEKETYHPLYPSMCRVLLVLWWNDDIRFGLLLLIVRGLIRVPFRKYILVKGIILEEAHTFFAVVLLESNAPPPPRPRQLSS